jgi:hypothetical protein
MDPATIATAALTILGPFIKDAGEDLVKTVGQVALGKAKELFQWLKDRFSSDAVAAKDLSRFQSDPDTFEAGLHSTIQEKAEQDPEFAAELTRRLDDLGPIITVFQDIKKGKNVVGVSADRIHGGKIVVTQKAEEVDGMIGTQTKDFG